MVFKNRTPDGGTTGPALISFFGQQTKINSLQKILKWSETK